MEGMSSVGSSDGTLALAFIWEVEGTGEAELGQVVYPAEWGKWGML